MLRPVEHTTRWSLVRNAARSGAEGRLALEELCRAYRPAVIAFLRRGGHDRDSAEEHAQSFFLHLLERDLPARADPARGRFRLFLRTALQNHVSHVREREQAQRRQAPGGLLGADPLEHVGDPREDPERAFDLAWALTVLERGVDKLRSECAARGQAAEFAVLLPALTDGVDAGELPVLAERLRLSPNAVSARLHRLRLALRAAVRDELMQTVDGPEDVDAELGHLRGLLGGRER
jgi:DNA-directed RNA polymerase specialized sigma24 family protein